MKEDVDRLFLMKIYQTNIVLAQVTNTALNYKICMQLCT